MTYRENAIMKISNAPKTKWYRLVYAYLFRGLNGKLKRHWLRSITESEALDLSLGTWSAFRVERGRRLKHLEEINNPPNYNRTKFKPII